ncbi:hypothetical protein AHAS_Ahas18G0243100 [Arachis hypogaea]
MTTTRKLLFPGVCGCTRGPRPAAVLELERQSRQLYHLLCQQPHLLQHPSPLTYWFSVCFGSWSARGSMSDADWIGWIRHSSPLALSCLRSQNLRPPMSRIIGRRMRMSHFSGMHLQLLLTLLRSQSHSPSLSLSLYLPLILRFSIADDACCD